jgi:SNF family Na+-dependent transporter
MGFNILFIAADIMNLNFVMLLGFDLLLPTKPELHVLGKVVKYTVFLPWLCLLAMALKGLTMSGAMAGIAKLFVPEWSALSNPNLWIDAVSQVFYSLSIMMAIMFAYGSFLDRDSNVATDSLSIAFSDLAISILSGVVMFTTRYGGGMTTENMSSSGIATAFIIYPTAIVNMTESGIFNDSWFAPIRDRDTTTLVYNRDTILVDSARWSRYQVLP